MFMAVAGVLVFGTWLVYDVSTVIQARHHPDEYLIVAVNIYLDIINIFLEILKFLKALEEKEKNEKKKEK